MSLSFQQIEITRSKARALAMKTRLVGDGRAQLAYEVAEAFLAMTEPDPRLKLMEPSIMLASGLYFNFLEPWAFDWNIDDIAHGLANKIRFGGHCLQPYTVAQHLVLASEHVEPGHEFEALMHDAHEFAYLDAMTPMKILMPDYRRLEGQGEVVMRFMFGLPEKMTPAVKRVDLMMLATEKRDLMAPNQDNWGVLKDVSCIRDEPIEVWSTEEAKERFLARFNELFLAWTGSLTPENVQSGRRIPGLWLEPDAYIDGFEMTVAMEDVFGASEYYQSACLPDLSEVDLSEPPDTDWLAKCKSQYPNALPFQGSSSIPLRNLCLDVPLPDRSKVFRGIQHTPEAERFITPQATHVDEIIGGGHDQ